MPETLLDKLPPQNLQAEQGVLGAILMNPQCMLDVSMKLDPADFYREAHKTIYNALKHLWETHQTCDVVMLADYLIARDKYKLIGGDEILVEIANSIPHAANVHYHAEIVKQKSIKRQVIQSATEIIRDGYSDLYSANEVLEIAEQKIFAISQDRDTGTVYEMQEAVDSYMRILEDRENGEITGLTTGFSDLDELVMGMRPKQFLLLAARPGQGKTSLAMDIGWHVAKQLDRHVLVISLEMAIEELTERMVSSISRIDSKRLKHPHLLAGLTHQERERMSWAMGQLRDSKLLINDCVGQSVSQIASLARRIKTRHGLDFLVVDYLGKIRRPEGRGFNTENDQLTYISNAIKELSGELRIPILCLHQLNRENVKEGVRPKMHHLRGSGSLEQDADVVMLIHNQIPEDQMVGQVELIVDKQRGGATGTVYLTYEKPFTRFSAGSHLGNQQY